LRAELDQNDEPASEPAQLPQDLGSEATELCRTLDGLGYAYEVRAARSNGDHRTEAAQRAQGYRTLARQVAEAAGLAGTESDPRRAAYDVGSDLGTTITSWQSELVPAWLALIGDAQPQDRPLLLSHAQEAAVRAGLPADTTFPGLRQSRGPGCLTPRFRPATAPAAHRRRSTAVPARHRSGRPPPAVYRGSGPPPPLRLAESAPAGAAPLRPGRPLRDHRR